MWLLLTILFQFVLPSPQGLVFVHVCGAMFMILPPLNCIRVLLCIRRHNAQLVVAAPSQMTTVLQREKKVALDMCIITVSLFASISPGMVMMLLQIRYPGIHSILHLWSFTMSSITSSIHPVIYFGRNKNMRRALKSIMNLLWGGFRRDWGLPWSALKRLFGKLVWIKYCSANWCDTS